MEDQRFSIDRAPQALAIVGAYSLVLSIAHEYGFFFQSDLNLLSLFSVDQLISNAIGYIPISIGLWMLSAYFAHFPKQRARQANWHFTKNPYRPRSVRWTVIFGIFWLFMILISRNWAFSALVATTFYGVHLIRVMQHNWLGSDELTDEALFMIQACIAAFLFGVMQFDSRTQSPDYELHLGNGTIIQAEIAKFTPKYTIMFAEQDRVTVISNDQITQISALKPSKSSPFLDVSPILTNFLTWVSNQFSSPGNHGDIEPKEEERPSHTDVPG